MLNVMRYSPRNNFTKIPNEILYNCKLSDKARLVLIYLLSAREDVHYSYEQLIRLFDTTSYSIQKAIDELVNYKVITKYVKAIPNEYWPSKTPRNKNIYALNNPKIWKDLILNDLC